MGNSAEHSGKRQEGLVIFGLFGMLFLASVDNQLLIPLLPLLSDELELSIQALGWLFSIYALSAALCNLLLGPLTDRFGRTRFLQGGLVVFAGAAFLTAQSSEYWQLASVRAVTGMAAGLLSTCTASFVGDYFSYERRGRVMGIVLSSYFAALIFGVPISSWIAERFHWPTIFYLSTGLALALLLVAALFPNDSPRGKERAARSGPGYGALIRRKQTSAALLTSFLVSGATLAFLAYISGYLHAEFDLSPVKISSLFLIAGVAAVIASPLSGFLSDRWTKRKVFILSNTLLVLPLLLVPLLPWGFWMFAAFFGISLGIAFRQTALQTLQTELISAPSRGTFLALRNCYSQMGISVSVFLGGMLYGSYGYFWVTVLASALTLAASLTLFAWVAEPRERAGGNGKGAG